MKTALRAAGENPFAALAVALAVVWVLLALAVPVLPLPDPAQTNLSMRLLPPGSPDHLLGSDLLGRDVLARLLWGTRLSLAVALAATLVAGTIGSLLGLLAGTARGWRAAPDALPWRSLCAWQTNTPGISYPTPRGCGRG